GIEIPGVARAARAAARLVVGQLGPRARIVGLLGLPGDDAALDVDLPRARAGAVRAVRRAHDLVVLPALAIAVLPAAVLVGDDPVPGGEIADGALEEAETIEEVAHRESLFCRLQFRRRRDAVLDVPQHAAAAGVEGPRDQHAGDVEAEEAPQCELDAA